MSHVFRGFVTIILWAACLLNCAPDENKSPEGSSAISKSPSSLHIPFDLNRNRIILPVRVGDSPELKIVLDTGMAFEGLLLYDKELTNVIALENAIEVKVPGAGAGLPSTAVMADSVSFHAGQVEFRNQRIIILQDDRMKGMPSDGVTGYSLFGRYTVEVDDDRRMIVLHHPGQFQPRRDVKWVPMTFKDNLIPWVEAAVNIKGERDIPLFLYIDLASGEALELLIKEGMKFELPVDLKATYLGTGLSGDIHGYEGRVASFQFGPFRLRNVKTAFAPGEVRSKQEDADGIIGNDILRRFNVVFDYQGGRLYLQPNSSFYEPLE